MAKKIVKIPAPSTMAGTYVLTERAGKLWDELLPAALASQDASALIALLVYGGTKLEAN